MVEKKFVHGTLYTVIATIFNENDQVLMFLRDGEEWEQGWEPIKGAVHPEETERQAVRREIKEESNLKVEDEVEILGRLPKTYHAKQPYKENQTIDVEATVFPCIYEHGEVALGEKEHREYKWMDVDLAIRKNFLSNYGPEMIGDAYNFLKEKNFV